MEDDFLSGFIAIAGPPNVGKSTLLNRILGQKVAIVSPKPQTTRNRILGVYHGVGLQMVFIDTPGIHKTRTALHRSMVASAKEAFHEVDMVLVIIETGHPTGHEIEMTMRQLEQTEKSSILVINKIDLGPKKNILPLIETYGKRYPFEAVVPVSALKGDGVDRLLEEIRKRLRPGPAFFPVDLKTDQTEFFVVAEIIREKIYLQAREEVPYAAAVTVDTIEEVPEKNLLSMSARIHVETDSQKKILIGRQGRMIRTIGKSARHELERVFGAKIFLDLMVRVEKNWSRNTRALRRLGY